MSTKLLLGSSSKPGTSPGRPTGDRGRRGHGGVWLGAMLVVVVAVWLGWVGWGALSRAGELGTAIASERGVVVGPVILAVVVTIFLAERRWPAVQRPTLARAHLVDAAYLALFGLGVVPLLVLLDTGFAVEAQAHAHFVVLPRLPWVPRLLAVGAILIGMDAMNWLAHLANHRSESLWRFHALHHSQEDMSVLTTFRTHPMVHASYLPALFPALILGASGPVPASVLVAYGGLVALAHANLPWTFGPLGRVFVSPAYHRSHHVSTPLDVRGAVNFGFVLVCWDQLAGRAIFATGGRSLPTGIAGRPVPVEQAVRPYRAPGVVLSQLAHPFGLGAATDGRP